MKPILRWVGGKSRLVPKLRQLLPADYANRRHVEPFAGSAALFFAMEPRLALLADVNKQLINFYTHVVQSPQLILDLSRAIDDQGTGAPWYNGVRSAFNKVQPYVIQAAFFWALNRSCFNGIYRVNGDGKFNVPYGGKRSALPVSLHHEANLLAGASMRDRSYLETLSTCGPGDFVYCDPPYPGTFGGYDKAGFGWGDQVALREACDYAKRRGAFVMVSLNDVPKVREIWRDWTITPVDAHHSVAADGGKRGKVKEVVIT